MRDLFRDQLEHIQFIHLKEDLLGKGGVKLLKEYPLPLLEDQELHLRNILEGILFLYGAHPGWGNREYYKSILLSTEEEVGGISLLPMRYQQDDKKKGLLLCLGLINLALADEGSYIMGAEFALDLTREGEGDYTDLATELIETGLEKYDTWNFHYHLGYLKHSQMKYREAVEEFSKAYHRCDQEEFRQEIEEMISFCQRKKDYEKAIDLLKRGRAVEATVLFESLKEDFTDWADLYYYLGIANRLQGNLQQAIEYFQHALTLEPGIKIIYQLSMSYLLEEDPSSSFALLREAIEKGVEDPSIYYQYSLTHYYLNDLKGAVEWMEKTLEMDPKDEVAQQWLDLMMQQQE